MDYHEEWEKFARERKRETASSKAHHGSYSDYEKEHVNKIDYATHTKKMTHQAYDYENKFYGHVLPSHFKKTSIIGTTGGV